MRKTNLIILALIVMLAMTGCYWRTPVETSEVGLVMGDGVRVDEKVGEGRYSDLWGWYAELQIIDVSNKLLTWEDPSLVTDDKQPIGLVLDVTYKRDRDCAEEMFRDYRAEAVDDATLERSVRSRIPRVAKEVTTQYSLDQMLGTEEGNEEVSRTVVQNQLYNLLEAELKELCVSLSDVGINDIGASEEYLALLEEKANAEVGVEVAQVETRRLREQLNQEEAQTEIEIERARRDNLVNEELAKVYEGSPQYYNLRRLELLADVIGDNDKVYFVPSDIPLELFLSGLSSGDNVPIPAITPDDRAESDGQ